MWEENLGTQAGVHLIEGVRLIWGPLNTGFTVFLICPILVEPVVHKQIAIARVRQNSNKTNPTYFFIRGILQKFAQGLETATNPYLILISIWELKVTLSTSSERKRKPKYLIKNEETKRKDER